jgi:dipeptidyl aminopeptidase/acylaminoacyl peptidase
MLRDTVVAVPNYRGSSGYGATWERVEDVSLQALDIAAVVNYLKQTFGLSGDKIVVVTSSTGLRPALSFLRAHPNSFGTFILTALVPDEGALCAAPGFDGAMFGFHGERDLILSPREADRVFLRCSESAKTRDFQVFSNEGHLFHRTASWVEVLAAVYKD